jgi:hypothetical protein
VKVFRPLFALVATLSLVLIGTGTVSASSSSGLTCTGTFTAPGFIAKGTYSSIRVTGFCLIVGLSTDSVIVQGDLTVAKGATLLANYPAVPAMSLPEGDVNVLVKGSVSVGGGATLLLGCSPGLGCANTTFDTVKGNLVAAGALGVVLHSDIIGGSLDVNGGGGGVTCTPSGFFALIGSPDYSASEGDAISGNVNVTNMRSCWYGEFGDIVLGNVYVAHNTFADPDATEIGGNEIFGNLACFHNVPRAQFGDNGPAPNIVLGTAKGECTALIV